MESEISKVIQAETMEEAIKKCPFEVGQLFQVLEIEFRCLANGWTAIAKLVSREQPLSLETIQENMEILRGK